MWNDFLHALEPTLITLFVAILTALGVIITKFATDHFGAKTAMLVSEGYQIAIDNAAGWLKTFLEGKTVTPTPVSTITAAPPVAATSGLTVNTPAVQTAVAYMKASFPDAIVAVEKAQGGLKLGNGELASDILGALGKLLPGPVGVIAGAIGSVIKPKT